MKWHSLSNAEVWLGPFAASILGPRPLPLFCRQCVFGLLTKTLCCLAGRTGGWW